MSASKTERISFIHNTLLTQCRVTVFGLQEKIQDRFSAILGRTNTLLVLALYFLDPPVNFLSPGFELAFSTLRTEVVENAGVEKYVPYEIGDLQAEASLTNC